MSLETSLKFLCGAVMVYVGVAACTAQMASSVADPVATAEAEETKAGARLKVNRIVAADGASQAIGFFDTQRNEACTFQKTVDGTLRCLPQFYEVREWDQRLFADAKCTKKAFSELPTCSAEPGASPFYISVRQSACAGVQPLYSFPSKPPVIPVYEKINGVCAKTDDSGFALGDPVPLTAFVSGNVQADK